MNGSWRNERYPVSSDPFRSLRSVAGWLIGLLALNAGLDVVATLSDISYLGLLDKARSGLATVEEGEAADARQIALSMIQLFVYLVTAVVFVIWFRRAYRNLGRLGATWLRFKPGWATGGWFVPLFNAVRQKEIANDIWRVSDPELPPVLDGPALGRPVTPLINLWWAAVLINGIVGRAIFGADEARTLDELTDRVALFLFGDITDLILSILAIVVVKKISDRQEQRWHRLSLLPKVPLQRPIPPPPPPPPPPPAI